MGWFLKLFDISLADTSHEHFFLSLTSNKTNFINSYSFITFGSNLEASMCQLEHVGLGATMGPNVKIYFCLVIGNLFSMGTYVPMGQCVSGICGHYGIMYHLGINWDYESLWNKMPQRAFWVFRMNVQRCYPLALLTTKF